MPFEIVRNDITNMYADAIVNTANPMPVIGTGVDAAIHKAAGDKLLEERLEVGDIARGEAKATQAYNLNAKYVIHTVGPVWSDKTEENIKILTSCYKKSLELAKELKCESVAFPLISTGNYGFPKDVALQVAVNSISGFLLHNEMTVYLTVFDQNSFLLSEKLFKSVESYIDEHYVEEKSKEEYKIVSFPFVRRIFRHGKMEDICDFDDACYGEDKGIAIPEFLIKKKSLEELLEKNEKTFSETLFDYLVLKDKKDPEVYKKANIDRKLFSKIRNNKDYKPSKSTALALAIALELNIDETKDFIGRAGYTLTHSSKADIIVEYFIVNGKHDIFELNEVLFYYGYPLIGA